jgi:hypothetical protein
VVFYVAAQAYRLAPPPAREDPWRLAFGAPDVVAPVFEYLPATPRALVARLPDAASADDDGWHIAWPEFNALQAAGTAEWLARGHQRLELRVTADGPAQLVLREIWDPRWRATVAGRPVAVRPINGLLRAIDVPAGPSVVTLVYRSGSAPWLAWLPGLALIVLQLRKDFKKQ